MRHPDDILRSWQDNASVVQDLVDAFFDPAAAERRYILGRNDYTRVLAEAVDAHGIVDDFAEAGSTWAGKPVLPGSDVPESGIVVNCAMSISPVSAAKRLEALNIAGTLAPADLYRVDDSVPKPAFVDEMRQDVAEHLAAWQRVDAGLTDEESRKVLEDLLTYRITGDYNAMRRYTTRLKDQYFEDFAPLSRGEVFVDAGGFDGDTTEEFVRRCPDYGKVLFFEPSETNLATARERLAGVRDIEFIPMGVSDREETLRFNADGGSASAISDEGSCEIRVAALDAMCSEPVTFIKMDLEGWEMKALAGAKQMIAAHRPKLAIAVYHSASDFREIFDCVKERCPSYDVYLRHYTEGWSETVMYFVEPR